MGDNTTVIPLDQKTAMMWQRMQPLHWASQRGENRGGGPERWLLMTIVLFFLMRAGASREARFAGIEIAWK